MNHTDKSEFSRCCQTSQFSKNESISFRKMCKYRGKESCQAYSFREFKREIMKLAQQMYPTYFKYFEKIEIYALAMLEHTWAAGIRRFC